MLILVEVQKITAPKPKEISTKDHGKMKRDGKPKRLEAQKHKEKDKPGSL